MTVARAFPTRGACALAVLLATSGSAGAIGLQQAYQAALKNDPAFRMNFYENEMGKENRVLGRAGLLPQVSAQFSSSRNVADQDLHQLGMVIPSHPRYLSRSSVVQLRQPLLNMDAIARYRQGKVQTEQSDKVYEANINEVALRVVGAYCDALFALDQVALARVQRDMYVEQQKVNERLFAKGEGTKTDMLETKARPGFARRPVREFPRRRNESGLVRAVAKAHARAQP
jgi:protease secretion system outer membrane protein